MANVIITEIVDPLDDYTKRYVEICNIGTTTEDISNYALHKYSNGATDFCSKSVPNGTILGEGDCFIFYHSSQTGSFANCVNSVNDIICVSGNGDDAYELSNGSAAIDIYGLIGQSGGVWDYSDSRVFRNFDVSAGTTVFNINEWTIEPSAFASFATPCASEVIGNGNACTVFLEDAILVCLSNSTASDEVIVDVPYSGLDASAVLEIIVNNTSFNLQIMIAMA